MSADQIALADELEALFAAGIRDFGEIADRLGEQGIVAPTSGSTAWTATLLIQELEHLNAALQRSTRDT